MIEYAIVTHNRVPAQIHNTLIRLKASGFFEAHRLPLRIVVGCRDASYLDRYRDNPNFQVEEMPSEFWDRYQLDQLRPDYRAVAVHCHALRRVASPYMVVLEDDVSFAKGWADYVEKIILPRFLRIDQAGLVLLYTPEGPWILDRHAGREVLIQETRNFYGAQGYLIPRDMALGYALYGIKCSFETPTEQKGLIDILLDQYLRSENRSVWRSCPSLIQHEGFANPNCGGTHRSECFVADVSDRLDQLI
jgi:hypothetical protein